jgi:hypothetical protein
MNNEKKKSGRSKIPDGEKKVQSYYYTKKKNRKKIESAVRKIIQELDV